MNYNVKRSEAFYDFVQTLANLRILKTQMSVFDFTSISSRMRAKANRGDYMNWSKEEFKERFIIYVSENSTSAFMGMEEMMDYEWTCYYNMYKCGNSMAQIFDVLIEEVYGDEATDE